MMDAMTKVFLCVSWFVLAIFTFATTTSLLYATQQTRVVAVQPYAAPITASSTQYPRGKSDQGIAMIVESGDARVAIVSAFLERYKSPLKPYDHFAQFIVSTADQYGVDYRLIPAIMMQESNLCKMIPEGSHNCLGFGIHKGGTLGFDSYEASIERATRELKAHYIDRGLTTPEKIMTKYTPHSNGSWANSVNQWIAEMEYNDRDLGKAEKSDADLTQYAK